MFKIGGHRKEDITPIHEDHDNTPNPGKVGEEAADHEYDRDDVVCHHLPVVFPSSFCIENEQLVGVEGNL